MTKRLSALLVLMLISLSIIASVQTMSVNAVNSSITTAGVNAVSANATGDDLQKDRAEKLILMARESMDKANETIQMATAANMSQTEVLSPATNNYTYGSNLLNEARTSLESGNYTKAAELAQSSMHYFKDAISLIMRNWNETGVPAGWRGLSGVIDKLEDYLKVVNSSIQRVKSYCNCTTFSYTKMDSMINDTGLHLNYAKGNLTAFNISAAAHEINRARGIIDDLAKDLQVIGHSLEVKGKRIADFIEHSFKGSMNRLSDEAKKAGKNISRELNELDSSIKEARRLAEEGDLKHSMERLRDAEHDLGDLMRNIHKGPKGSP